MTDALNIGTLVGRIELDDAMSSSFSIVLSKVEQFSDEFEGMVGAVTVGAAAAVAAIGAITAAVVTLGVKGSDIQDVTNTMEQFAGGVLQADEILQQMRRGVLDTVDDFDLMKQASRLLSANVKLNAADFNTLTSAAFVLQNRGLGSTKDMLGLVSNALVTGRTRSLAMALGVIDAGNAEVKYAQSLGLRVDQLTRTQKVEATRLNIMEMMRTAVEKAGVQERDFGEKIDAARVKVKNWIDELARRVAVSAHVNKAIDEIGAAFQRTFGGGAQTMLERIIGWIDRFADSAAKWGPRIIQWLYDAWQGVKNIWTAVNNAWDRVPDWFKKIATDAALAGVSIFAFQQGMQTITGQDTLGVMASFAMMFSGIRASSLAAEKPIRAVTLALGELRAMTIAFGVSGFLVTIQGWLAPIGVAFTSLIAWIGTFGTSLGVVGTAILTFLSGPVGWIAAAVVALIAGLRILTGSWEFILTPVRAAWQAMLDVGAIFRSVASDLVVLVSPQLKQLWTDLSIVAQLIQTIFITALAKARGELQMFWFITKNVPGPIKDLISALQALHILADSARGNGMPDLKNFTLPDGSTAETVSNEAARIREEIERVTKASEAAAAAATKKAAADARAAAIAAEVMAREAERARKLEDINRKIEQATASVGKLTDAQKMLVQSYDALGLSNEEIAIKLNIASGAVSAYLTQLKNQTKWTAEILQQLDKIKLALTGDQLKQAQARAEAITRQFQTLKNFQERNFRQSLAGNPVALRLREIEFEKKAVLDALGAILTGETEMLRQATLEVDQYYNHLEDLAVGTADTIVERMAELGYATSSALAAAAREAKRNWEQMAASGLYHYRVLREARERWQQLEAQSRRAVKDGWDQYNSWVDLAVDVTNQLTAQGGAGIKALAGVIGIAANAWKAYVAGATAASIATAAATAGISLLVGAIIAWFQKASAERKKLQELNDEIIRLGVNLAAASDIARRPISNDRWVQIKDLEKILEMVNQRLEAAGKKISDLGSLTERFGNMAPQALQPYLNILASAGGLTDEQKEFFAMLGGGQMNWQWLDEQAERFGIAETALGKAFQQTKIGAQADEIYTFFQTAIEQGAIAGDLIAGLADEVQDLVTRSQKAGTALPEFMKSMVGEMIKAGLLVDEFGNKLVDVGQLSWTESIESTFQKVAKILEDIRDLLTVVLNPAQLEMWRELGKATDRFYTGGGDQHILPVDYKGAGQEFPLGGRQQISVEVNPTIIAWDGRSVNDWLRAGGDQQLTAAVTRVWDRNDGNGLPNSPVTTAREALGIEA